jgi:hypothetical protein
MRNARSICIDFAVATALVAIGFAVFHKVIGLWWMYDDPFHLNLLRDVSLLQTLYDGGIYRALQRPLFTPLQMLSLKLDLRLFGADAEPFYFHQLIAYLALPPLQYAALRLSCSRFAAAIAAITTTVSGPTLEVVPLLMLRHYVEGAVLAMLATILCVRAFQTRRPWLAVASAVCYFLATGCKEIYAPLPLLFAVLPEDTWRNRFKLLIPHAVAALCYAIWRLTLVGWDVGAYDFVAMPSQRFGMLLSLPLRAVGRFAGSGSVAGLTLMALILVCSLIVAVRLRPARIPLLVGLVVAFLPILPVATELQARWTFVLWVLTASLVAFVEHAVPQTLALPIFGLVLLSAIVTNRIDWPREMRLLRRMSDEARALATLGPNDILRNPATPAVTMLELERLTGAAGRAFYDDLPLCNSPLQVRRVFEYDVGSTRVRETGPAQLRRSCAAIRMMPLSLQLRFDQDGTMYWTLGPYNAGSWAFILTDGQVAYDVPRLAGFRGKGLRNFQLRVRYTSPAGWRTYSPLLTVDASKGSQSFNRP